MTNEGDRTVYVVSPHGVAWMVRFLTEDAAWARIVSLKGLPDNEHSRSWLRTQGWKVEDRP
jgi:hypothetical protein